MLVGNPEGGKKRTQLTLTLGKNSTDGALRAKHKIILTTNSNRLMFSHDDVTEIQQPVILQTITILSKNCMKNFIEFYIL
jgi:hypothetical protein